jgi:hypothetical protein
MSVGNVWRLVDAQYAVSTRKLVDSRVEQGILEGLVDAAAATVPSECQDLDDLLSRPFRYAPYPKGSRFRRAGLTPGVYYAAEQPRTAAAELAFYRLLFFAESPDTPWPASPLQCTGFSAAILSPYSLDLTKPPSTPIDPSGAIQSIMSLARTWPTQPAKPARKSCATSWCATPRWAASASLF